MNVVDRVVDERLREIVDNDRMQFGFMKGNGTTDAVCIVRQIKEKMLQRNNKLYCTFMFAMECASKLHKCGCSSFDVETINNEFRI